MRNKVLPKSKINILTTPQNPKNNSLKMPDFKAKFCSFFLCFIAFSMCEMGFREVMEYGRKKTPLTRSGGMVSTFILLLYLQNLIHLGYRRHGRNPRLKSEEAFLLRFHFQDIHFYHNHK